MATTESTNKLNVIDEEGLDTLLAAVFSKLRESYVSQSNFESKVAEILESMGGGNGGLGFVAFDIRPTDGHLIVTYSGDEAPNMRINEEGHFIVTL